MIIVILFYCLFFSTLFYFTILYWFYHTSTWIRHGFCICICAVRAIVACKLQGSKVFTVAPLANMMLYLFIQGGFSVKSPLIIAALNQ